VPPLKLSLVHSGGKMESLNINRSKQNRIFTKTFNRSLHKMKFLNRKRHHVIFRNGIEV
jgi:hypothetical protein